MPTYFVEQMFELLILCMLCGMDNFANKNVVHFVINQRRSVVERWTIQSNATSQAKPKWPFKRTVYRICAFMHRTVCAWKKTKRCFKQTNEAWTIRVLCSGRDIVLVAILSMSSAHPIANRTYWFNEFTIYRWIEPRSRLMSIHAEHSYYSDNRGNMYHEHITVFDFMWTG